MAAYGSFYYKNTACKKAQVQIRLTELNQVQNTIRWAHQKEFLVRGCLFLAACQSFEEAYRLSINGHCIFTYFYLIKALRHNK
jgi:hypothetical protein